MGLLSHRRLQSDASFLDWVMRLGGDADAKTKNIRGFRKKLHSLWIC